MTSNFEKMQRVPVQQKIKLIQPRSMKLKKVKPIYKYLVSIVYFCIKYDQISFSRFYVFFFLF